MKKMFLLGISAIAIFFNIEAQTGQLMVRKGSKGFYLDHSVAPKEGLYAIGRLYNVHPKHLAAYNQIDLNKGLAIGQIIQIPLNDTNFTQKTKKGQPVYYVAGENESLSKVSSANNKVAVKDLRSWNKLTNDNPAAGTKLIVGFLMASGQTSAVAASAPATQPQVKQEDKAAAKAEKIEDKKVAKAEPAQGKPVVKDPPETQNAVVKSEPEKQKATTTDIKESPEKQKATTTENKETPEKSGPVAVKQETGVLSAEQGYFKNYFDQQVKASPVSKNATLTSGIFKTTSGWQDAKYYLLIDGVATGTIIKVTNPDNNKAIYAKVLGEMNGIRQNQGLDIRISNAAASTLGVPDSEKFVVKVNY